MSSNSSNAPAIPSIAITSETGSTPRLSDPDATSRNNTSFLTPSIIIARPSSEDLASPTATEYSSVPPSPTISNHSTFPTSLALRGNDPGHLRKPSNATFASTTTEPDSTQLKQRDAPVAGRDKEGNAKQTDETDEEPHTAHQQELVQDSQIDAAPYHFKPFQLAHMLDPKSLDTLISMGGVDGLLKGLGTNVDTGLLTSQLQRSGTAGTLRAGAGPGASHRHDPEKAHEWTPETAPLAHRQHIYGTNTLPQRASKSLLALMWLALKDKVLVLLSIAALISLALGFYQDFGIPRAPDEPPVDWVEGVAIMIAIFIVVIVGSLNDWQKEKQFRSLNEKKEERGVKVIRDGSEKVVDIKEVVVGDIALVEPGEIIPCDGIFLGGHNVKCDESGATGESDAIKKVTYDECLSLRQKALSDPGADAHSIVFVNFLIISVTLIVVAVPEGLPLAVTLALAFATKRMTYEKLLVRVLGSCETMANASVVCTDKTGTLTQNDMTVVAGSVGLHAKFVHLLEENEQRTNANRIEKEDAGRRKHVNNFSIDQSQLNTPQLRNLFNEAITVNSTAFQDVDPVTGEIIFIGSKTETALLKFTRDLGWPDFKKTRDAAEIIQMIPFSSDRKAMGVVVRLPNGRYRIYLKGASEILSRKCTRHVVVHKNGDSAHGENIETRPIDPLAEDNISRTIIFYANQMLRTIAICYRDLDSWPPRNARINDADEVEYEDLAQNLTLIGITGIEDPLRPGVREAVAKCAKAGVSIKMCTGDNVLTARSIAQQCGIFTPGGIIMEGPYFRQLSQSDMIAIVPRLQVLARSSPEDKKILVETLKAIGEVVGVTGDGTNDGPALKTANVGFSMGIAGTEVAKEASDIILMDDNFASIVKAIIWGRCVNDSVRKFLQFQISTNVTAVVITFVTAVASVEESSVLTAVQLLWINIIMDTFAALALATDPATEALLDRKPDKKTAPLFTVNMYKMILIQSIYQIIIILIFHFLGLQILGLHHIGIATVDKNTDRIVQTLVFNTFVFAQIFNSVNCRRLDRNLNIFEGIHRNWYFIIITLLEIAVQIVIVFIGGAAFQVTHVGGREWGISLALGFVSIPLGVLVRLLPNAPFEKLFTALGLLGSGDPILPTENPSSEGWFGAVNMVNDSLQTYSKLRGGRLRSTSIVSKARLSKPKKNDQSSIPVTSMFAMVPTMLMGTFIKPEEYNKQGLSDPTRADPSVSSTALWAGRVQFHPDTPHDDPAFIKFGNP
ncbi:calcium-translocating P-type ATPase [Pluteus cervinus]|uniref:Calcium-translocating P-type ATPase n=1 Tax=Pluteus cervinus TaxID=181527 RepID=A0ACD3BB81_9AGAR|nr:calcium-translocating P-type ATPase [Pluteus cervinus]